MYFTCTLTSSYRCFHTAEDVKDSLVTLVVVEVYGHPIRAIFFLRLTKTKQKKFPKTIYKRDFEMSLLKLRQSLPVFWEIWQKWVCWMWNGEPRQFSPPRSCSSVWLCLILTKNPSTWIWGFDSLFFFFGSCQPPPCCSTPQKKRKDIIDQTF